MAVTLDTVFLSSTAKDLANFRDAVFERLRRTNLFHVIRQEDFGPEDATAQAYCEHTVAQADILVGLIGLRRGWEPHGDNQLRSITEMEHDWSRERGIRRHIWVAPDTFAVPGNLRESDAEHARQLAFRARIRDGGERIVSEKGFGSPELLASEVVEFLLARKVAALQIASAKPRGDDKPIDTPREDQEAGVAAALDTLAGTGDIDLLAMARSGQASDPSDIEAKLKARADALEAAARAQFAAGQAGLREAAQYWRHIGAVAFLHDTNKALAAYAKAVELDPDDADGLRYLGELQFRRGELAAAEAAFERLMGLGLRTGDKRAEAMGCLRLEWIFRTRGDLSAAEEMAREALRLAEADGWTEGMARCYGNLGVIYQTRGDLERAEETYRKALALEEELGGKEGMARCYGNLGVIYQTRGNLVRAEEMQLKSLALYEELGGKEGMAASNGNLGVIYETRGDLVRAEEMQLKSLALHVELGSKNGLANCYCSLGNIYLMRGDLVRAEEMQIKALGLEKELGSKEVMATSYANLGVIYQARGDLVRAEEMQLKALALNEELGRKGGMAITCFNLGSICERKGDVAAACGYFRRSREVYVALGNAKDATDAEQWLRYLRCPEA
jgi:tetratricopeptide (TPR) repeat protein